MFKKAYDEKKVLEGKYQTIKFDEERKGNAESEKVRDARKVMSQQKTKWEGLGKEL